MITDEQIEFALKRIRESQQIVSRECAEVDSWLDYLRRNEIEFRFTVNGAQWQRRATPQSPAHSEKS